MSPVTRYHGWSMAPPFMPHGPTRPVMLAIDDEHFTQWIGDPPTVWQTPLSEVRDLEVSTGRRLTLRATIGGVRYRWTTSRGPEHEALIDQVRAHGAAVGRDRRRWTTVILAAALVGLVASAATIAVTLGGSSTPTSPSPTLASRVGLVNVTLHDLPGGWAANPDGLLVTLTGPVGVTYPSTTRTTPLTGPSATLWHDVSASFQGCVGVTAARDRMFGSSGQQPEVQVAGNIYTSTAFGGTEIGSATQYYAQTSMVAKDLAEYQRGAFGRCWGLVSAQILSGYTSGSLRAATTKYATTTFSPITFAHGFRRGGVTALTIPNVNGSLTLVSLFAASGHYEVSFYALTTDWGTARPTVIAAFEAMMSRLGATGSSAA